MATKKKPPRVRLKTIKYALSQVPVIVRSRIFGTETSDYLCGIGTAIPQGFDDLFVESITNEITEVMGNKINIIVITAVAE